MSWEFFLLSGLVGCGIIFVMKLESQGILINLKPFGNNDCIASVFTADYGLISGLMKGALVAKKNKPLVAQFGNVVWNARLDSQLGTFHWEATKNLGMDAMRDSCVLGFMNSMFALILAFVPERENFSELYNKTCWVLDDLNKDSYLQWELCLLKELGYALDLTKCSGCGGKSNLSFLSPRTGRAVCCECGEPYADRLYKLPVTLNTTLRFIEKICDIQDVKMPVFRLMIKS